MCYFVLLLKTHLNVFAMTHVEGSAYAGSMWGSWTVISAVL
jgi:hypothetical protein